MKSKIYPTWSGNLGYTVKLNYPLYRVLISERVSVGYLGLVSVILGISGIHDVIFYTETPQKQVDTVLLFP